ncbi:MAG: helix-turn-helix domain-containing protein [Lachnospiraceae bacterium]|nr:helix-turn-helix domain-containing protein [Lachnospiraceae bacterium]
MEVGKRIKQLREQKNYTINKLANEAGVSQSYLRDIELENKNPTIEFLSLICKTLNISLKDFFDDEFETSIMSDPVIQSIYRLTPQQKTALLEFLKTMQNE